MLISQTGITSVATLSHEGKVILVVTISENNKTALYYSVKQDGFEDSALQNPNGSTWETLRPLELPQDSLGDASVLAYERDNLTYANDRVLLRSVYNSAGLTAAQPVQLISHDGYVYIFRQSTRKTLLVDRFVLDGMTNTLVPRLEVRYRRSRQRYKPQKSMRITSGGQLDSVDTLDFRDMQNQPFYEPSTEICPDLLSGIEDGWFGVVVTATTEQENYRWHIFACRKDTPNAVTLLSLRAGGEQIFDVQDTWFRTFDPLTEAAIYDSVPGIIERQVTLQAQDNTPLTVTQGPAAVRYDVQREQQTQNGPQLIRDASKVLLTVPTAQGSAAISFAIAANGTLAQIAPDPATTLLRSQQRDILLPLSDLDNIRAYGKQIAPPSGTVVGLNRSSDDDTMDRLRVQVKADDLDALARSQDGDLVRLSKTGGLSGVYPVEAVQGDSFTVALPDGMDHLGDWEKVEPEEAGLVFDGLVTAYAHTPDGKLRISAVNHGLEKGDTVQILGDASYDGEYPILKLDKDSFTIQRVWESAQAVNIRLESRKRRGMIFDGATDWIEIPVASPLRLSGAFTMEAWVRLTSTDEQTLIATSPAAPDEKSGIPGFQIAIMCREGRLAAVLDPHESKIRAIRLEAEAAVPLNQWVHVAVVYDGAQISLHQVVDSVETVAVLPADKLQSRLKLPNNRPAPLLPRALTLAARAKALAADGALKQVGEYLHGQLSEIRLWTVARSPKDLSDSMTLPLTGREPGLAGYWRLGGIAIDDEGAQTIFDFSVNANHGIVHGTPYAGARILERTLSDNATEAVMYSNDDLIAVREGAIYLESFEFRTDSAIDPNNADGQGGKLFTPSLWGQFSRGAEERQAIDLPADQANFQFAAVGDGWTRATVRFIVPEGVRLLRCFEIGGVSGSWKTLEIRRHALRLVSDTITHSRIEETARLTALTSADGRETARLLADLEVKQDETFPLVKERRRLEQVLAALSDRAAAQKKLDAKREEVRTLTTQVESTRSQIKAFNTSPAPKAAQPIAKPIEERVYFVFEEEVRCPTDKHIFSIQLVRWIDALVPRIGYCNPDGSGVEYYQPDHATYPVQLRMTVQANGRPIIIPPDKLVRGVRLRHQNYILVAELGVSPKSSDAWVREWLAPAPLQWETDRDLFMVLNHSYLVDTSEVKLPSGNINDYAIHSFQLTASPTHLGGILGARMNYVDLSELRRLERDLSIQEAASATAQADLKALEESMAVADAERAKVQRQLDEVNAKLTAIEARIAELNGRYLQLAAQDSGARTMPDLADQADPNDLKVQGSLLPWLLPRTRLTGFESCTGRVSFTWQDADNRLRTSHYDTAYDADGKGEEWLPDAYPTALAFNGKTAPLAFPDAALRDLHRQVTIEFWARGGDDLPTSSPIFAITDSTGAARVRILLPNEAGEVVWEAGSSANGPINGIRRFAEETIWRGDWNHWAFVKNAERGEMRIYLNGALWYNNDPQQAALTQDLDQLLTATLAGVPKTTLTWMGQIADLRIWNIALGEREIESNAVLTLSGNEPGLIAYYPMNEGQGAIAHDVTGNGRHISVNGATWIACTAPFGLLRGADGKPVTTDMAVGVEYSRIRVDAQKRKSLMMLRAVAFPTAAGLRLLDEGRIEVMEMKWIGNAQIRPTLIGYIEGAPPLPSENLTEEEDYNGATTIELIQSSDVEYSWTREQDVALGAEASMFLGIESETSAGLGISTEIADIRAGVTASMNFAYHWQNASTVGASHSLMSSDRLELRGTQEADTRFPQIGQRFIPKNIGYAVITSGLADVFVSRLKRSGRMIGYQLLPVEGVPLDVNTITFLINPAYTMAGSLDGMTGTSATSDRFFRHVPEMRSQYGSLYPASYFRLKDAYALKAQIDEQDKLHQAYFNQFNAGLVDETSLDRQVNDSSRDGQTVGVDGAERSGGESSNADKELDDQIAAKEKEVATLKKATPVDDKAVQKASDELETLKQERNKRQQAAEQKKGEKRQDAINSSYSDLSARANASESFAGWQKKMENLQIRAGKRNIVNTYVWDGDGGFHAEEQQFASTVEHTIGGSFDLGFAVGGELGFGAFGAKVECSAQATVAMTQTMSKTEASSKGMELHVDLSGVESRNITDYKDRPILPGEKVDRYRFMSFYLEGSARNWHDFFNTVVDPEWLASNDEEARALRETRSAAPNKVWRVLHRVTYVERPSLMGFGRLTSASDEAVDDIRALRDQLTDLNTKVLTMQQEMNEKLNQLLSRQ